MIEQNRNKTEQVLTKQHYCYGNSGFISYSFLLYPSFHLIIYIFREFWLIRNTRVS